MAKFGKKLLGLAVVGAAAAGVYYYLKKENEIPVNLEDEDEDLDNFDDFDVEDKPKRAYVNLDLDTVETKAKEVAEKAGDFVKKSANTFESFVSQAGTKVEEFFDDKKSVDVPESEEATCEETPAETECESSEEITE